MAVNHAKAVFVDPFGNMTEEWYEAMKELDEEQKEEHNRIGICSNCGAILDCNDECDNC